MECGDDNEPPDGAEEDLWFLPGPMEDGPSPLRAAPGDIAALAAWRSAEAGRAAHLARVAGRLGALDDRLRRGPAGWRQRLALIEAAELSWHAGDRIAPDRLALWVSLRAASVQGDTRALARAGWAMRRLAGGPGPEAGLADFLGRHEPDTIPDSAPDTADLLADRFADRAAAWLELMGSARALHPITRAAMGFHLWRRAGLEGPGGRLEAAVTASRIAAGEGAGEGAGFAPLAMGGAQALQAGGAPAARLACWLDGVETATRAAMRHLDDVEAWSARAETVMDPLSGRTPAALRGLLAEWPFVSAPMAQALTGASRAAVQRNLGRMEARGLLHEITGQGRFRMWRARIAERA